jgi:F-type H+-transporting ATPase subunit c
MIYFAILALAIGLAIGIAAFGGALGQGRAVAAAMEGMARQPEAASTIQTGMIIGLALIESLVIYALVISLLLIGKFPDNGAADIIKYDLDKAKIQATAGTGK